MAVKAVGLAVAAVVGVVVAAGAEGSPGGDGAPGSIDGAWSGLGLAVVKRASQGNPECLSYTFGEVHQLMTVMPCVSLSRSLTTLTDGKGVTIVVHTAWVEYGTRAGAREFQRVEDIHGTGDVTPLPGALVDLADVEFSARHYASTVTDTTTVLAETEAVAGAPTDHLLHEVAEIAVLAPRP
ncbi:hypothetical protein [Actinosynnema sp. NPDC020468]|uniref:hypothetical protein n=1 Tax=Actinosynnema sp. NPDC020468 TaxID=3154488 RepID=UPI0033DE8B51